MPGVDLETHTCSPESDINCYWSTVFLLKGRWEKSQLEVKWKNISTGKRYQRVGRLSMQGCHGHSYSVTHTEAWKNLPRTKL